MKSRAIVLGEPLAGVILMHSVALVSARPLIVDMRAADHELIVPAQMS